MCREGGGEQMWGVTVGGCWTCLYEAIGLPVVDKPFLVQWSAGQVHVMPVPRLTLASVCRYLDARCCWKFNCVSDLRHVLAAFLKKLYRCIYYQDSLQTRTLWPSHTHRPDERLLCPIHGSRAITVSQRAFRDHLASWWRGAWSAKDFSPAAPWQHSTIER